MRDSQYKSCAVQNQFTAYLIAAIRNYKRTYLRRISTALRTELPMEGHSEVMELCEDTDFFCGLPLMQRLENERLFAAIVIPRCRPWLRGNGVTTHEDPALRNLQGYICAFCADDGKIP